MNLNHMLYKASLVLSEMNSANQYEWTERATDNLAVEEKLFVDCQSKARARLFSFLRAFVHQLCLTDERNVIIVVSDAKRSTIYSSTADVSATLRADAKATHHSFGFLYLLSMLFYIYSIPIPSRIFENYSNQVLNIV